jgi:hypothetical protein
MTLADIIKSNSWLSVKLTLEKLFPDQNEFWDDYEKMTPGEKEKNTYTWDEVKERFKKKDND